MNKRIYQIMALCTLSALGTIHIAQAAAIACTTAQPIGNVSTTGGNDCQLTAIGTKIDAIYVFADAGGISKLSLPSYGNIFSNDTNSTGDTVLDIPTTSGQLLDFTLTAVSVPNTFVVGIASSDNKYHAAYRDFAHYSDFNAPALTTGNTAYNYMNANGGLPAWTFVAWEDYIDGDYDYNDLIFAFRGVTAQVPEPSSMLLLMFGALFAMGAKRRGLAGAA